MSNFIKQISSRLSILLIISVISSVITACGGTSENASQGGTSNAAQNKIKAEEKHPETNKTATNTEAKTEETIVVYDGRKLEDKSDKTASAADKDFVWKEFQKVEAKAKQQMGDQYCSDPVKNLEDIYGVAEGSYTKPNSSQKAYLYYVCELGRGFGVGGIMIVEDQKVVSNYLDKVSWSETIHSLPDINKNGLNEILLAGGGSGQGYTTMSIDILEFASGKLNQLGQTETYSSNGGAVEKESEILSTAYKISVQPAKEPIFTREVFEQKGNSKNWTTSKKAEKFNLDKTDVKWKEIS